MLRIFAFLVCLAIANVSYADEPPKFNAEEAKEALADRLKDPYSAQFRNIRFFNGSGDVWNFCGEVNSKNAYGGYVGYTKFAGIAIKDGSRVEYTVTRIGEFAC